jgi:TRAP-type mannitol/chloroaromatic compound transport system permease large subunit
MLVLIVVVIMMGFPTAFTLMGLGMFFGFFAYHRGGEAWAGNFWDGRWNGPRSS